jgi:dipeptidyl aminopeptidase/acylaminoacyl peptidase
MRFLKRLIFGCLSVILFATAAADTPQRTTANDGNLVMEDIPPIPAEIVQALNRYQNVRAAGFRDWTEDGSGIYISTRFGDVSQIHRVDMPGGARQQVTFYDEPIGSVTRQPQGSKLSFTRDAGGSEFAQVFLLDPATGDARMLTDGESRNGAVVWDRQGRRFAFRSTRRNGASNDLWIMDPTDSGNAELILKSPDGTSWSPAEFSASGSKLLLSNYVSIADSRVHLLDLDSGASQLLAGGTTTGSANSPVALDDANDGFWFITDQAGEFRTLAWQALDSAASPEFVTTDIPWDVEDAVISHDRSRMAFKVNENGRSGVYLLDPATRRYGRVDNLPVGLVYNLTFSPDDRRLAMNLSTATSPSDVFVLELGEKPLDYRQLVRWTTSEVGGLDASAFRAPELVHYPTFDSAGVGPRMIPAWVYTPPGEGPFPVIISIHGGPEGQSRPGFSSTYPMWMNKLGAAVIRPNVRGSAGYGKSYLALDNGFRREDSVRDIGALLDWIGTQPQFDRNRIAVIGGSYGGYMALASAVHYSDRLKAVVDRVGISSFVTFLENTQDYRRDLRRVEYGDERDPAMRAHLEKISPLNNVDKMTVPMFVIQGQNDPRVPVTEAEQVVAALREQGRQVWYMNALNEGHGYRKKENRDIYEQATIMFFRTYLLAE